jgi:hypothetical protein
LEDSGIDGRQLLRWNFKDTGSCNRPTDVQALGGFYFRRVVGCHCELFRRLSFLPAYKKVVVRLL